MLSVSNVVGVARIQSMRAPSSSHAGGHIGDGISKAFNNWEEGTPIGKPSAFGIILLCGTTSYIEAHERTLTKEIRTLTVAQKKY